MTIFQEYALLIAVAIPVLALVGLNVILWFGGERGTLLMPTARDHSEATPMTEFAETTMAAPVDETPAATGAQAGFAAANADVHAPTNDAHARKAA